MKILKNYVFQAYGVENIKLVASERRSSNIKIYFSHLILEK